MNKKDIFIGLLLGLFGGFIGCFIVLKLFTNSDFVTGFNYMKNDGSIGKIITLGAIPNLLLFFFLIKKNKDLMARGVILSMFVLTIITLIL
jgi:hypothetical protein